MAFDDRRQFPRFPVRFVAWVDGPRGPMRGTCTDLSLGGLFVEGVLGTQDAVTTVKVDFPHGAMSFSAQVRRVSTAPKGTGLQFMRLEPQQLAALQRYTR
ncbi:MAG: PilZ domain-containing protein [Myxococcota bacterium]